MARDDEVTYRKSVSLGRIKQSARCGEEEEKLIDFLAAFYCTNFINISVYSGALKSDRILFMSACASFASARNIHSSA